MWLRDNEALETTPLLSPECSSMRHGKDSAHPQKRILPHSPKSAICSELESGPSCSRPLIHRRSFSTGSDLATLKEHEHSPNLQWQRQPLFSRSELRAWMVELRLENSGSVARDHLASERTFLAYMRTSLAISSSGVALVQLFSATSASSYASLDGVHNYTRSLGASTVILGLLVLFIGTTRYFTIQSALTKGFFPAAQLATGFVAMMLGLLVALTFGILFAEKLKVKE